MSLLKCFKKEEKRTRKGFIFYTRIRERRFTLTEKNEGWEKDLREWKLCAFIFFPLCAITEYDKSFWNNSTTMNITTHDLKWCIFGKNKIFDKFTIDLKTNVGHHLFVVQSWWYQEWNYETKWLFVNNDKSVKYRHIFWIHVLFWNYEDCMIIRSVMH